jgi:hypothetical protein
MKLIPFTALFASFFCIGAFAQDRQQEKDLMLAITQIDRIFGSDSVREIEIPAWFFSANPIMDSLRTIADSHPDEVEKIQKIFNTLNAQAVSTTTLEDLRAHYEKFQHQAEALTRELDAAEKAQADISTVKSKIRETHRQWQVVEHEIRRANTRRLHLSDLIYLSDVLARNDLNPRTGTLDLVIDRRDESKSGIRISARWFFQEHRETNPRLSTDLSTYDYPCAVSIVLPAGLIGDDRAYEIRRSMKERHSRPWADMRERKTAVLEAMIYDPAAKGFVRFSPDFIVKNILR